MPLEDLIQLRGVKVARRGRHMVRTGDYNKSNNNNNNNMSMSMSTNMNMTAGYLKQSIGGRGDSEHERRCDYWLGMGAGTGEVEAKKRQSDLSINKEKEKDSLGLSLSMATIERKLERTIYILPDLPPVETSVHTGRSVDYEGKLIGLSGV